jgi:hypothetical protein
MEKTNAQSRPGCDSVRTGKVLLGKLKTAACAAALGIRAT